MASSVPVYAVIVILGVIITVSATLGTISALRSTSDRKTSNQISSSTLAWSLFASGMGSWILYALPEVGASLGSVAVLGYATANALPVLILAFLGPRFRSLHPSASLWSDCVHNHSVELLVGILSLAFIFIVLIAELTGIAGMVQLVSPDTPVLLPILSISLGSLAYVSIGGLLASILTDQLQAVVSVLLIALAVSSMLFELSSVSSTDLADAAALSIPGLEAAITLILAVTPSTLFLSGYWQRVWAGESNAAVYRGSISAAVLIFLVSTLLGFIGMLSITLYPEQEFAYLAMFTLLAEQPLAWSYVTLVLACTLALSVVDTLQTSLSAQLGVLLPDSLPRSLSRALGVLINIPAILLASYQYDVLRLFLIADLLTAVAAMPVLLHMLAGARVRYVWAGTLSGVVAVAVQSLLLHGSPVEQFTLPEGLYATESLVTFTLAVGVSTLTTLTGLWIHS